MSALALFRSLAGAPRKSLQVTANEITARGLRIGATPTPQATPSHGLVHQPPRLLVGVGQELEHRPSLRDAYPQNARNTAASRQPPGQIDDSCFSDSDSEIPTTTPTPTTTTTTNNVQPRGGTSSVSNGLFSSSPHQTKNRTDYTHPHTLLAKQDTSPRGSKRARPAHQKSSGGDQPSVKRQKHTGSSGWGSRSADRADSDSAEMGQEMEVDLYTDDVMGDMDEAKHGPNDPDPDPDPDPDDDDFVLTLASERHTVAIKSRPTNTTPLTHDDHVFPPEKIGLDFENLYGIRLTKYTNVWEQRGLYLPFPDDLLYNPEHTHSKEQATANQPSQHPRPLRGNSDLSSSKIDRASHTTPANAPAQNRPTFHRSTGLLEEAFENVNQTLKDQVQAQTAGSKVLLRHAADERLHATNTKSSDGLHRLAECYRLADTFTWSRSIQQKEFHDAMFEVCTPHIIGKDEYPKLRSQLLRSVNRKVPTAAAMLMCPRRWGKSICSSMGLALMMWLCKGVKIIVISVNQNSARDFMKMVQQYYMELSGGSDDRVLISNEQSFKVAIHGADTRDKNKLRRSQQMNSLRACTTSVDGLRGVTADIIVLEEAAAIPREVVEIVVAPLLKVSNTCFIALSTTGGSENYYTDMFYRKDAEAKKLFITVEAGLYCNECREAKLPASSCHHLDHLQPPWLSENNEGRIKALLGNNMEGYNREVLNVFASNTNTIFPLEHVDRMFMNPRLPVPDERDTYIFSMVDIAGNGDDSSYTAISSFLISGDNKKILVGLSESNLTDPDKLNPLFRNYMSHFYHDPVLRNRRHWIALESNFGGGYTTGSILKACKDGLPGLVEFRAKPTEGGATTNAKNKTDGVLRLQRELSANRIHICNRLASFTRPYTDSYPPSLDDLVFSQLNDQFAAFRKTTSKNGTSVKYDGKVAGYGKRDDMLMTLVLGCAHYVTLTQRIANDEIEY